MKPLYDGMEDYQTMITRLGNLGYELTVLIPCAQEANLRVVEFDCVVARPRLRSDAPSQS